MIQSRFNSLDFQKVIVLHATSPSHKTYIISITMWG